MMTKNNVRQTNVSDSGNDLFENITLALESVFAFDV